MSNFIKTDIKIALFSFVACTLRHYFNILKTTYDHEVLYEILKTSTNQNVLAFAYLQIICNTHEGEPCLFCVCFSSLHFY